MINIKKTILTAGVLSFSLLIPLSVCSANNTTEQLITKGKYIAVAADCGACHRQATAHGKPYAGGNAIDSPMGRIIASNITPSESFGIGNYTEKEFANAVRRGIAADGSHLYPAMPYTAYHAMTDTDLHALYSYFMYGVNPVDSAPEEKTSLSFPFNIRQLMWGWNLLFSSNQPFREITNSPPQVNRGKYLVEVLGHCSTCHTPRNLMMAEDKSKNLSGSPLGGWYAPNITPDKDSGIGSWSQQEIVVYLKTGHIAGKASAAGPMAETVENSFRYLSDSDLNAIATWIKQVPVISTAPAYHSAIRPPLTDINKVISGQGDQASLADSTTTDGSELYNAACASCHGINGQGTADHFYPSLTSNSAVSSPTAQNLVMTIVEGLNRKSSDGNVSMPAFGKQLTDSQIASVTRFVRYQFSAIDDKITAQQVTGWRNGGDTPFIVSYINYFIGLGGLAVVAVFSLIIFSVKKRRQ